jgi:hypothetical protein
MASVASKSSKVADDAFVAMSKSVSLPTLSEHKEDRIVVIRMNRVPETESDRAQLFDLASKVIAEAAETAKRAKSPVLRMIWDFGNLPLDPRLNMPPKWTADNADAMKQGLVRSAVIVQDLMGKKMVQTWQRLMGSSVVLPPSKIFRDNKKVEIGGQVYSLGAWDAYNYAVRGDKVGKFDKASLSRILSDPEMRRRYMAPWRPTVVDKKAT